MIDLIRKILIKYNLINQTRFVIGLKSLLVGHMAD